MQKIFDKNKNIVYNKIVVVFCYLFFGGGVNESIKKTRGNIRCSKKRG